MPNFFKALKRGAKAAIESFGPSRYLAAGIVVTCSNCKEDDFEQRNAQFNTSFATFLNLDWLNKSVVVLICAKCGLAQWYNIKPQRIDD